MSEDIRPVRTFREREQWMSAIMADERLTAGCKVTAIRLSMHLNFQIGQLNPSMALLAKETAQNWRSIVDHVQKLRERGWVDWVRGDARHSNQYQLRLPIALQRDAVLREAAVLHEPALNGSAGVGSEAADQTCAPMQSNSEENNEKNTRLRPREPEAEVERKVETIPDVLRRGPDGFEDFWRAGDWHPNSRRTETIEALRPPGVPPLPDLTAAAKRYFDGLSRGRKHDPAFAVTAAKFIREAMWRDYPAPEAAKPLPDLTGIWGGHVAAETLRGGLGDAIFATYFAVCTLTVIEGHPVLMAPSKFISDWIEKKYSDRLERAFGVPVNVGYARNASEAA